MNTQHIELQNSHLDLEDPAVQKALSLYDQHEEAPYISPNRNLDEWLEAVEIGSESLVPKRNMVRLEEGILPGYLILLWRISFSTFTNESPFPKYFEYTYGINAEQALDELLEKHYVKEMSTFESLTYLNAAQLKDLLKKRGGSGFSNLTKGKLMQRVRSAYLEDELESLFSVRGYKLTSPGLALLGKYPEIIDKHPKKKF
ncbi:hypothetical protein BKP56_01375 [Marinilactibacillus sp. 15R]|uniref:Uncharacterized protein n=1 Tax=Marinilactibacillus piezotolerans TaxID=258723 RepID=A0A1I3XRC1_9LACT|nr:MULTISPECIES: hypothetical protein [Marinilactibacillus]API88063.1 hypothetical protein BKP56_01375 [Marinilactibacillus sp. 15R]SFK22033.1 hypothetical protein SAMN04488569_101629 [Marinilactibacillus piezotolerans]